LGALGLALLATVLTMIVLAIIGRMELRFMKKDDSPSEKTD
jgi:hypothetical protein